MSKKEHVQEETIIYNIVTIGDSRVGKTCVISRMCGKPFSTSHITTMGVDKISLTEKLNGKTYIIKIWDTTGQERFASLATQYLRKADGVIFVYAVNDKDSYNNISKWVDMLKKTNANPNLQMVLVANKIDLERIVSTEEGNELAQKLKMNYSETSAKTGEGIKEVYDGLVQALVKENDKKVQGQILKSGNKKEKSCCK